MINILTNTLGLSRAEVIAFLKALSNAFIIPVIITLYSSNLLLGITYILFMFVIYTAVLKDSDSLAKRYFIYTSKILGLVILFIALFIAVLVIV